MPLNSESGWGYNAGGGVDVGTYTGNSLTFNSASSQYLSRTPASDGNRKTWTFSCWLKRHKLGTVQYIFNAHESGVSSRPLGIKFTAGDKLNIFFDTGASYRYHSTTNVFRDTSAWYHIVLVWDTTEASIDDRLIVYVNNELQATASSGSSGTVPTLNQDGHVNDNVPHYIGTYAFNQTFNGDFSLAGVALVDGQALDPFAFGHYSTTTGAWVMEKLTVAEAAASGGTETTNVGHKVHTFTADGTLTVTDGGLMEYLVVGGGGSGGGRYDGGGGGAGGFRTGFLQVPAGTYSITVGAGGTGSVDAIGNNGGNSVFHTITSTGGGAGARSDGSTGGTNANSGGSGGGGTYKTGTTSNTFGAGTGSEGNAGGQMSNTSNASAAGGGGGAGAVGANPSGGSNRDAGDGGAGLASDIIARDTDVTYAGGGGGAAFNYGSNSAGTGGSGGGGNGGLSADGTDGTANTGGGGGGTSRTGSTNAGGDGGSGIVVVRYFSPDSFSFGTNGFYFDFSDADSTTVTDNSANSNTYNATNYSSDVDASYVTDTPVNNFATLNPLMKSDASTFSNGNQTVAITSGNDDVVVSSIAIPTTGKWAFKVNYDSGTAGLVGVITIDAAFQAGTGGVSAAHDQFYYALDSGNTYQNAGSGTVSGFSTLTAGTDDLEVFVDMDAGTIDFSKNGGSKEGSNSLTDTSRQYLFSLSSESGSAACAFTIDNDFTPSDTDFLPLNTVNLPEIEIGQEADDLATDHFNTVIYTGNNTSGHSITGMGFSPDLLWIQPRSNGDNGVCFDSVRGNDRQLKLNSADAEDTHSPARVTLEADGFDLDTTDTNYNGDTRTYVAHGWLAGEAIGTGDFTQGTIASTAQRNTDAGFSIVSYTGTGSAGTIGHGLSKAPEFIIFKNRDSSAHWTVYHVGMDPSAPEEYQVDLNGTGARYADARYYNDTAPTATVMSVNDYIDNNESTDEHVAYCFHSVDGYCKVGGYEGNNADPDGTFVYTGFPVGMVIIRNIDSAANWEIFDNKRSPINEVNDNLRLDNNNGESTSGGELDFLSNGFKLRTNYGNVNDANTFIYIAFSSGTGFKYGNAAI